MANEDFNFELLKRLDTMNDSLTTMSTRLTELEGETKKSFIELSGRIKGNHELIKGEIQSYVSKDSCENHRERQGERIGKNEQAIALIGHDLSMLISDSSFKKSTNSEMLISWLPDLVKIVAIVGGLIFAKASGWL